MATTFRAVVMLVVLVGLPAAWVYYGPLPPAAMGVIERTIASAKHSVGWGQGVHPIGWSNESPKTAPRFDATMAQASQTLRQQTRPRMPVEPTPMMRDSRFSLASATMPELQQSTEKAEVDVALTQQLEPHLSLLRSLDAVDYTLENWGGDAQLYRFRCSIALGTTDDHTRQFEAVDADPLHAVQQVVGEVTSWQNARHTNSTTQWR